MSARPMRPRITLYVAGDAPNGQRARENITQLCEHVLEGDVELEIVDILATPQVAYDRQIVAVPVLIREHPRPVRKLIGNLADKEHVLHFLALSPVAGHVREFQE